MFFPPPFLAGLLTALLQVLPLAAARYNDFAKGDTPFSVIILADGFYLSSGFLNVLLYRCTRPYLLPLDNVNDQSIVLDAEIANSLNHLTSPASGFVGSVMDLKPADPIHEASENGAYRNYALTASPVRDEMHIRDSTGTGVTNIDDDI